MGLEKEQKLNVCERALGGAWHTLGTRQLRLWLSVRLRGAGDPGFPMRDRACSSFPVGPLDAMLAGGVFTEGFFRGQWEVDPGSQGG